MEIFSAPLFALFAALMSPVDGFFPKISSSSKTKDLSSTSCNRILFPSPSSRIPTTHVVLSYTLDENIPPNSSANLIDTSCYQNHLGDIQSWLSTLPNVERSEPEWLSGGDGGDVMSISPSLLIQEHLDAMYGFHSPKLFPSEANRSLFDFQWRYALLSSLSQSELDTVLSDAQSNSHPLAMYLAIVPPNCTLNLHVHAAIELFVPMVGTIHEQRAMEVLLPRDTLSRHVEMEVGALGGEITSRPTAEQIRLISNTVSERLVYPDYGHEGQFVQRSVHSGQVELNDVGSVHQSYTKDSGCLLFVLGSRVHGQFKKGNFHQRRGIERLKNIDDLLD